MSNLISKLANTSMILFIFLLLLGSSCSSTAIDSTDTDNIPLQSDFISAEEMNKKLSRGINMGNALEAPSEGAWGLTIKKEYFSLIRAAGFQSVRIPVRWSAHTSETPPYKIDEPFMDRVHEVVNQALEEELVVIINVHHFNELMENPDQQKEKFLSLWKQISESFMGYSENLLFEVLNEPHSSLTSDLWNSYLQEAITTIRVTNPGRVLLAGTAPWGGFNGLQNLQLPESDKQIIATVHYYNPFRFTHQGAEWVEDNTESWIGTTWTATDKQKNDVDSDFQSVKEWSLEHQRPVHLGEFGAYSKAPETSREIWTSYVRESAESRGFSWAYWEFGSGFGVYDRNRERWRSGLLEALIPDR